MMRIGNKTYLPGATAPEYVVQRKLLMPLSVQFMCAQTGLPPTFRAPYSRIVRKPISMEHLSKFYMKKNWCALTACFRLVDSPWNNTRIIYLVFGSFRWRTLINNTKLWRQAFFNSSTHTLRRPIWAWSMKSYWTMWSRFWKRHPKIPISMWTVCFGFRFWCPQRSWPSLKFSPHRIRWNDVCIFSGFFPNRNGHRLWMALSAPE